MHIILHWLGNANEIYTLAPVHISHQCSVYILLTRDTACRQLIGVQKPAKSADFFDAITVALFSYIGHQVSCDHIDL